MCVVEGVARAGKATYATSAFHQVAVYVSTPPVVGQVVVIAYLAGQDSAATSVRLITLCYCRITLLIITSSSIIVSVQFFSCFLKH